MKSFARFVLDSSFYEIAKINYARYVEIQEEISALDSEDPMDLQYEKHKLKQEQNRCGLITICFSAMCVEAFIYDYAARNTSDTYVKKYLDKLDALAKWVVIPKLVTGKDFPTDSHAFSLLKILITTRNRFVHFKSSDVPGDEEALVEALRKDKEETPKVVRDCFMAVEKLFIELRELDVINQHEGWYVFTRWDE